MGHESITRDKEATAYSEIKRMSIVFSSDLLAVLDDHADTQGVTRASLLRSFIKLKEVLDKKAVIAAADGKEAIIKVGTVVIDTKTILEEYGDPDFKSGRINLEIPYSEHSVLQQNASLAGQNITDYVRTAAALGIKIEDAVWETHESRNRGYHVSVGEEEMTLIL
jgi:hypothetical protein